MYDGNMNNFEIGEREFRFFRRDVVEEMCGVFEDGVAFGFLGEYGVEVGLVR